MVQPTSPEPQYVPLFQSNEGTEAAIPQEVEAQEALAQDLEQAKKVDGVATFGLKRIREKSLLNVEPLQEKRDEKGALQLQGETPVVQTTKGKSVYIVTSDKESGVEPGFEATKAWTEDDDKKLDNPIHKFADAAEKYILAQLVSEEKNVVKKVFAESFQSEVGSISDKRVAFLKQVPEVREAIKQHIMQNFPKFKKKHYVKLDYTIAKHETEKMQGSIERMKIPKFFEKVPQFIQTAAKKVVQSQTAATRREINQAAVQEALANDVYRALGIESQKLKIIRSKYSDGTPKLLLDSTHAHGPAGEEFHLLKGNIKMGRLEGNQVTAGKDEKGNPILVTLSEEELAKAKAKVLLMGDRDKIGSSGANIGYYVDENNEAHIMNIDPGKALDRAKGISQMQRPVRADYSSYASYLLQRLFFEARFFLKGETDRLANEEIASDLSFLQPKNTLKDLLTRGYKNFEIFDDTKLSDRIAGMKEIVGKWETVEKLFNQYIEAFGERQDEDLNFAQELKDLKGALKKRKDYFVQILGERLALDAEELDVLDNIEKLTSPTLNEVGKGDEKISFKHLQTEPGQRREWHMKKEGEGEDAEYTLTYTPEKSEDLEAVATPISHFEIWVNENQQAKAPPWDARIFHAGAAQLRDDDSIEMPEKGFIEVTVKGKANLKTLLQSLSEENIAAFKGQPLLSPSSETTETH